ncbi:MAG: HupE/UreJ family protein [Halieaceae bacterium]|nr:HupE/UreJ family protein [Halieaceae bacterium]
MALAGDVLGHGVDDRTRAYLVGVEGLQVGPFLYIGAKHMVTGYDHLLFLFGVVFLLDRLRDVLLYVTLFTVGHSTTLLLGVLAQLQVNAFLVDAVIGLSVVYKGFDNLGGFGALSGGRPDPRLMVLAFGLVHGLGLATKLQDFDLPGEHLPGNLLAFNAGVELGQILALSLMLVITGLWRGHASFQRASLATNTLLMTAGVVLIIFQLTGFFMEVR